MLLILVSWIYVLFMSFLYGHAFITFLSDLLKEKPKVHFSVYVISGLVLISAITSIFSLFIKLGALVNGILLITALVYLVSKAKTLSSCWTSYLTVIKKTPPLIYLLMFLVVGIALVMSAAPHAKFDDGLYYRQSIKWMENYPAIAGLGNLHLKFSFNSSWHVLSALFSFSFLGLQLNDLNGFLFIIVSIYALDGLRAIMSKQFRFSDVFKVVTFAPLHLLYSFMLSPSPDLVIPYLIWIVFVLFLQKLGREELHIFDINTMLILIISLFAVVIKLSAAPIGLLSLYLIYLQLKKKNYKVLAPVMGIVLFLLIPWMARNVVLSGYLVYPIYYLDLFDVDWKIPVELVKLEVLETKSFAKIRRMLFTEVDRLSIAEWLPYWFWQLRTSERLIVLLVLALSFVLPVIAGIKLYREKITEHKIGILMMFATIYAGIFFWFFTAPHFRYGMGFTVGLYLLCLAYFLHRLSMRYTSLAAVAFPLLLLLFFSKPLYNVYQYHLAASSTSIIQPGIVKYKPAELTEQQGLNVYIPDSTAQCWDSPLPCAPFVVDGLQLRTGEIKDGFRIKEANPGLYNRKRLESMKSSSTNYNILNQN